MTVRILGAAMVLTSMTTSLAHADPESIPEGVLLAADKAGVDPVDLLAASNATGLTPEHYLCVADGLLCPSAPPAPVVSNSRVACIEAKESGGANVANRRGSGAVGVLQYMPSTFAAHAREMGHPEYSPWVPWQAREVAAHDLALGRRSQWTVSGC